MTQTRELFPVAMVDAGIALLAIGGITLALSPFARAARRKYVLPHLAVGTTLIAAGFAWPVRQTSIESKQNLLDEVVPKFQFSERHRRYARVSSADAYEAIHSVTADEIQLYRALTWIRRFGRSTPESILNPANKNPILQVALRTGFHKLAEDPGKEIVIGSVLRAPGGADRQSPPSDLPRMAQDGHVLAAMNFQVRELSSRRCVISTETRVYCTGAATCRWFACYWRTIYPGSALIRRMWLRAITTRAELLAMPETR